MYLQGVQEGMIDLCRKKKNYGIVFLPSVYGTAGGGLASRLQRVPV